MHTRPAILILLFVASGIVWVVEATTDPVPRTKTEAITEYVTDFMRVCPRYRKPAIGLVPLVVRVSTEEGVDPFLMAVTVSKESAWRINGKLGQSRGEVGLTQVHGLAAKGQDLTNPEGQIRAGARWMKRCLDKCGSVLNGINAYLSGRCRPVLKQARRRHNIYIGTLKRYWNVDKN